jgi:hypothetical protein
MPGQNTDALLPDREHYRELTGQLREMVRVARFPFARKELLHWPPALSTEPATLAGTRTKVGLPRTEVGPTFGPKRRRTC